MCYTCNISDNLSFHQQFSYKEEIYERGEGCVAGKCW